MRVYLPVTAPQLAMLVAGGELGPPPLLAYAVTPALREGYASGNDEELEYAAMTAAARASLQLLADAAADVSRRLVVAADVDTATPDARYGKAVVVVDTGVPLQRIASVHADTEEASADVRAAVAVLRRGGLESGHSNEDDAFTLDACEGHELAWFATQEIVDLVD